MNKTQMDKKFRAWDKKEKKMLGIVDLSKSRTYWEYPLGDNDNYILMQYTGLKDKNGKEIYEGDILEYGGAKNEVKYIQELAIYADIFGLSFSSLANESKVIGNIYENKELLK